MNHMTDVATGWSLSLTPRPDAFAASAAVDGHNVWRNNSTILSPLDLPTSIQATVPGCIQTDLIAAGLIADISVDGREADQMWIWKTDSIYRTVIKRTESRKNSTLKFYGLDTIATIFVNGLARLQTKNMHRSYEIDISSELTQGDVQLEVHFKAPLTDAEEQVEKLGLYPRPYDMPYNYQRKMACSYGWDWGPITISSGIWKKVQLIQWDSAYLSNVAVLPTVVDTVPHLSVKPIVKGESKDHLVRVRVIDGTTEVASHLFSAELSSLEFDLPNVELWQPRYQLC